MYLDFFGQNTFFYFSEAASCAVHEMNGTQSTDKKKTCRGDHLFSCAQTRQQLTQLSQVNSNHFEEVVWLVGMSDTVIMNELQYRP